MSEPLSPSTTPPHPMPPSTVAPVVDALRLVVDGGALTRGQAHAAMACVMDGAATSAQLAALLVALRMRGETVDELAGFARAMRERVIHVAAPAGTIDTCGTGGDGRGTFNISTAAALVVAAAGVPVAKHGNRAISSGSGSSEVLEALGVPIRLTARSASLALRRLGFAFLFAPDFHPAMRHAGPTRREIGIRTAFNLLGPVTNPAGARRQVVGVPDERSAERLCRVLQALGTERSFVVTGDRIDELPLDGSGVLFDVCPQGIERRRIDVSVLGLQPATSDALVGGEPQHNAVLVENVLRGERGPRRDVVVLNAGAALEVAGSATGLRDGVAIAARTIDRGQALALLGRLRAGGARDSKQDKGGQASKVVAA